MSIWNISYKQLAYSIACHITVASHATSYYQIVELALPPKNLIFLFTMKDIISHVDYSAFRIRDLGNIDHLIVVVDFIFTFLDTFFVNKNVIYTVFILIVQICKKKNWLGFSLKTFLKGIVCIKMYMEFVKLSWWFFFFQNINQNVFCYEIKVQNSSDLVFFAIAAYIVSNMF